MKTFRVLICGGHPVSRHALAALLKTAHDMIPVLADEGPKDILRAHESSDADLILWDESRARYAPSDLQAWLNPTLNTPVIILGYNDDPAYVIEWLSAGARGYILGDAEPSEFFGFIREAARGEPVYPPTMAIQGKPSREVCMAPWHVALGWNRFFHLNRIDRQP